MFQETSLENQNRDPRNKKKEEKPGQQRTLSAPTLRWVWAGPGPAGTCFSGTRAMRLEPPVPTPFPLTPAAGDVSPGVSCDVSGGPPEMPSEGELAPCLPLPAASVPTAASCNRPDAQFACWARAPRHRRPGEAGPTRTEAGGPRGHRRQEVCEATGGGHGRGSPS